VIDQRQILAAADLLIGDFGGGRVADYFTRLAPDATFLFHTAPQRMGSRDAYRALWDRWVADDGFRVLSCSSSNRAVHPLGADVAVLLHDVATRIETTAGQEDLRERETVVFARRDGEWLVVHEHLSAAPASADLEETA
jgi:ketosteroid isomerase-like protein